MSSVSWQGSIYAVKNALRGHTVEQNALAYKWIRIIYRLWPNRELYCEQTYINQLTKTNSPIIQFLETSEKHEITLPKTSDVYVAELNSSHER